jgi:hypothetical protein
VYASGPTSCQDWHYLDFVVGGILMAKATKRIGGPKVSCARLKKQDKKLLRLIAEESQTAKDERRIKSLLRQLGRAKGPSGNQPSLPDERQARPVVKAPAKSGFVLVPIECTYCKAQQTVHIVARTGAPRMGYQSIPCIRCERDFDVLVADKILSGPFPA